MSVSLKAQESETSYFYVGSTALIYGQVKTDYNLPTWIRNVQS
jgi:hypothetical protein|tara:strand:+ start:484 stop:612 length:129 start_codon:yes stop_codon:yes gene_type:complete